MFGLGFIAGCIFALIVAIVAGHAVCEDRVMEAYSEGFADGEAGVLSDYNYHIDDSFEPEEEPYEMP